MLDRPRRRRPEAFATVGKFIRRRPIHGHLDRRTIYLDVHGLFVVASIFCPTAAAAVLRRRLQRDCLLSGTELGVQRLRHSRQFLTGTFLIIGLLACSRRTFQYQRKAMITSICRDLRIGNFRNRIGGYDSNSNRISN